MKTKRVTCEPAPLRAGAASKAGERCELLHQLALDVAAGAGVLHERQRRLAATARWHCGTPAADHMKTDLLDGLLDELGHLPGGGVERLREVVAATVAECTTLRGPDYLERCTTLLADAASSVLALARSLDREDGWRRHELLGIAGHLAWCGHKDGEQHAALSNSARDANELANDACAQRRCATCSHEPGGRR
jgi:hypothetical protein